MLTSNTEKFFTVFAIGIAVLSFIAGWLACEARGFWGSARRNERARQKTSPGANLETAPQDNVATARMTAAIAKLGADVEPSPGWEEAVECRIKQSDKR